MRLFESPLRSLRVAALMAGAIAALVSANTLHNEFAYDDVHIVVENEVIRDLARPFEVFSRPFWPGQAGRDLGLWRPVTTLALGLQYSAMGETPVVFHLVNVLLHACVTALAVALLSRLMPLPGAFVAGLVFAVHPVHVEAVANVVGQAELLAGLCFLLACLVHVRGPDRTGWGRALTLGLLYALAFGVKESAVTLPAALILIDGGRTRLALAELPTYLKARWKLYFALGLVAGALLLGRFQVLGTVASPIGPLGGALLEEIPRIWTVAEIWSHYVRLLVFPLDLSADYSPNVIPVSLGWNARNLVGLGLALGLLAGAMAAWRRPALGPGGRSARIVGFGVVWFVITILPVSNLLFLTGVLLAERTLYLPSLGFAAAVGWAVLWLAERRPRVTPLLFALALFLMAWRSWERNPTWKDNGTVFLTMIEGHPHSGRSQWAMGDMLLQRGQRLPALAAYSAALRMLRSPYDVLTAVASKLMVSGHRDTAERLLLIAWRDSPGLSTAPRLMLIAMHQRGDAAEAMRIGRLAVTLGADDAVTFHILAWALAEQGRWADAAVVRRLAIAAGEGDQWQQWHSLAALEAAAGDTAAALAALDSAEARGPGDGAARQVDSLRMILTPVPRWAVTAPP